MIDSRMLVIVLVVVLALAGCRGEPEPGAVSLPEHVEVRGQPREAWTLRLSPAARAALGIEVTAVKAAESRHTRSVAGFVIDPLGSNVVFTAPLSGVLGAGDVPLEPGQPVREGDVLLRLTPFAPVDRDLRARAELQRAGTRARVELLEARVERTRQMLERKASSQRELEEAMAELAVARSEDDAARARERAFRRAPMGADVSLELVAPRSGLIRSAAARAGQAVATAAALFEIAATEPAWVRVPVSGGDLDRIARDQPLRVARLGETFGADAAMPVVAPPSANPLTATVDLYYSLESSRFVPGERVQVELPYRETMVATRVPSSALVVDVEGGTWVWECLADNGFRRRRVDVARHDDSDALLRRGPALGTCIVEVGALELLGAEFGVEH